MNVTPISDPYLPLHANACPMRWPLFLRLADDMLHISVYPFYRGNVSNTIRSCRLQRNPDDSSPLGPLSPIQHYRKYSWNGSRDTLHHGIEAEHHRWCHWKFVFFLFIIFIHCNRSIISSTYWHLLHIYFPRPTALTLALHSWHRARFWFRIKPQSANSLEHISHRKQLGCQLAAIALITRPITNSPHLLQHGANKTWKSRSQYFLPSNS